MAFLKQIKTVYVASVKQNGTLATASMTSDFIDFEDNNTPWSLNVWFTGLVWAGTQPTITIEVSNETDTNSFRKLTLAVNKNVPEMFFKSDAEWRYLRIIYTPNGASAGTKNFDLMQLT